MYINSKVKNECCGCGACQAICPKSAIRMKSIDNEGFVYPVVDANLCIHCRLCERVCPINKPEFENSQKPLVFACYLSDKEERMKSSSGGLFLALARKIILQGGIVYGAAFDANLQLKHIGVETLSELERLRGSKYLQSNTSDIYKEILIHLKGKRMVYFVGTPCQVAALNKFIGKSSSKKYLLTSDLVCHGVPSQELFDMHVTYMESKYGDKMTNYQFRNNKQWGVCEICDFANHHTIINPTYELSPYLYSFMYGYTYRMSCYDCPFAHIPRQGDITLADYWGVDRYFRELDTKHGVSLILLNSQKGVEIWDAVKHCCEYKESNIFDAAQFNPNLIKSSTMHVMRQDIYSKINKEGYRHFAENEFRPPHYYMKKIYWSLRLSPLGKLTKKIFR